MTNRDRLLRTLRGEPTDRVPVWLLFPYHRIGCYTDVLSNPDYREVVGAARERAAWLNRRTFDVPLWAPEVQRRRESLAEDGWTVERQHLEWRDVHLWSETRRRDDEVRVRKLINSEEELAAFCRLPVETDPASIRAALERQVPDYLRERGEFPEELGSMMIQLGEPIGPLYANAELSEYPVWSLTCDDLVRGFLDRVMERLRVVYGYCLERDLAETYFLIGSELASPPMVGRETFRRWIVPYAKELIAMIHGAGRLAIQHYHGQIREILPDFVEMAPDALHTIEAPPTGNCTMTQAFDVVGERMALVGNIQYDCFRSYAPDQMRSAVRELLAECRGRRLVLSPTAGPYEEKISDRMRANYLAFMAAGWEYGARQ